MPVNALSFDIEDYFQVSAFSLSSSQWQDYPSRVMSNTWRLLELCAEHEVKATFFTLGWVAERCPQLVRDIVSEGHELASHGYWHHRVSQQSLTDFAADLRRAKQVLEQSSGQPVIGYRAPSFSLTSHHKTAYQLLADLGHSYSSSVYPIRHDHYGEPEDIGGLFSPCQGLVEIPLTALPLSSRSPSLRLPLSGGGYFRLLPYALSHWGLKRAQACTGQPAVFYLHPWELDPHQPRVSRISPLARLRHYLRLNRTEAKLSQLLQDFEWDTIAAVYRQQIPGLQQAEMSSKDAESAPQSIPEPVSQPVLQRVGMATEGHNPGKAREVELA